MLIRACLGAADVSKLFVEWNTDNCVDPGKNQSVVGGFSENGRKNTAF